MLASETVDAAQALADLTEISSQIEAAVLFDEGGAVLGSTLADDEAAQALARAGAALLERAELNVIAEASNGREALQAATEFQPGIAILDISMPVLNGCDAYRELGRIPTVSGARTSLFVAGLDRLFLAVRARGGEPAAIWVYRPKGG